MISEEIRKIVWQRDKGKCQGCGLFISYHLWDWDLHHVYFRGQLKSKIRDEAWNLCVLCKNCHTGTEGVHNGNRKLDKKLKAMADIRMPYDEIPKEIHQDILNQRQRRKKAYKKNVKRFIDKHGCTPTQYKYRKQKEWKKKNMKNY
jgi:hypothetical protein